jgi:hypothetical protein
MRMGRVIFTCEYIVDLDDLDMVDNATDWMWEDIHQQDYKDFLYTLEYEEDDTLGYGDIHSGLLDMKEEEEDEHTD